MDADWILAEMLGAEHEQVVLCSDQASGLRAVIAIYSTALGPALGGTRFYPYESTTAAIADALRLSKAMAYKNSLAGLDHGGGKAVIIGDPTRDRSESLLRAYGRFIQTLGGRYVTACDVGTFPEDMDVIARETPFATGRSEDHGGAGDSSVLTAYGVFQAMRAAAQHVWGSNSLEGRRVGIVGAGKVGTQLAGLLLEADATVVATDVSGEALARLNERHPDVHVSVSEQELIRSDIDIYAPCALGGSITEDLISELTARVICGGANNQMAHPRVEDRLDEVGITYAPDFCVNAGGVIQVADELHGFSLERARSVTEQIYERTLEVLQLSAREGLSATSAASLLAEERMERVGALQRIRVAAS